MSAAASATGCLFGVLSGVGTLANVSVKTAWKPGDRVVHATRPEWGVGEVRGAERDGAGEERHQRLTIRFDRAGLKTLSTQYADLRPASDLSDDREPTMLLDPRSESRVIDEKMLELPEDATDPFKGLAARLEATLRLYRFSTQGASLLDWAAAQSGLSDPLTKYTRHELEALFDRFRQRLDGHAQKLATDLSKQDPAALTRLLSDAAPAATRALRQFHPKR